MKTRIIRCLPLMAILLLAMGLCGVVSAEQPPFNDATLDWRCDHSGALACAAECPDCGEAITDAAPHTYTDSTDPSCNVCGETRGIATIVTQPQNGYAQMGKTVSVTVEATGDDLTYTWYYKNAGKTTYSKSSATTATYSTKMSAAAKDREVVCYVCDKYGNTVQSDPVLLRETVSITTQPVTTYTKMGATAKASVTASGDGLTYTWYFKNAGATKYSKSSVTAATYSTKMSATTKGRMVYCVVKDQYGNTVTTSKVTLREAVSVTTQPKTTYTKMGATAKVSVTASGDSLTYTWYFKNASATKYSKSSVTTATYSAKMTSTTKGRMVYCVVKDKWDNTVTTSKVTLREAVSVTTQPKTTYTKMGATAKVSVTASGDGLTYTWYIKNAGKTAYSKSSVTTAAYSAKMSSTTKGRMVYCVVKDKWGNTVTTSKVTLREAASITTQPKTVTVKKNATAKVSVKASGDGLTYTWYYKNAGATKYSKSSVTTAAYSVKMTATTKNRQVYCVVKDKWGNTVKTVTVTLKMK